MGQKGKKSSMKLLVTGGAGFMGSNFIRYILNKYPDCQIVNLDKLTYAGRLESLKDVENDPRYRFIKGDIVDEKVVQKALDGIDVIFNYAAETHVDRSIENPKDFAMTDVIGTLTLLQAAKKNKVKRFIQVSTDEVFGSIEKGQASEDAPFLPNSPYSASKAGGDHLCRAFGVTYRLPVIITHSVNFYGPYQYPEKLIPLFITNLLEGKKVPLYGTGKNVREWIYTDDHCAAVDTILQKGEPGEIYNVSSEEELDNLTVTKMILHELGKDESFIEYVRDRPGHDLRYALDATKLKKLGWSARVKFQEGLRKTINWYKENSWWWKPLK